MSETRRRAKDTPRDSQTDSGPAPRHKTRVTLTKDVSSKYRKILPKGPARPAGRPAARPEGPTSGRRYSPRSEGSNPGRRYGSRPEGSGPARRPGPKFGAGRLPARPRPAGGLEIKIIVDRELPEAARQLKETQELILVTANEMLTLTETLTDIHSQLEAVLATESAPLSGHLRQAQIAVTGLYEKMSFQDLAGQRLAKIDHFFQALSRVLSSPETPGARGGDRYPARRGQPEAPSKYPTGPKLKGPQARGGGLAQGDIDSLLQNL
ncbi:MAG: hypothetical protein LBP55_05935 [Candidatus Adiutrix sp.]|nr:hypothetical protein [Candidatus Adiutrix sp.]